MINRNITLSARKIQQLTENFDHPAHPNANSTINPKT